MLMWPDSDTATLTEAFPHTHPVMINLTHTLCSCVWTTSGMLQKSQVRWLMIVIKGPVCKENTLCDGYQPAVKPHSASLLTSITKTTFKGRTIPFYPWLIQNINNPGDQ